MNPTDRIGPILFAAVLGLVILLWGVKTYAGDDIDQEMIGGGSGEVEVETLEAPYSGPCIVQELDIRWLHEVVVPQKMGGVVPGGPDEILHRPKVVAWFKARFDPMDTMAGEPVGVWMVQVNMRPKEIAFVFLDKDGCDLGAVSVPYGVAEGLLYMSGQRTGA